MKRIIILLSLLTVLFAGVALCAEEGVDYIIPGRPPDYWTPPEHIQPGGVELEVIPENYLELYSEEISELVSAVSLTNFDVAISEFDSMPLLGTNGEYQAILIMFTEGTRVEGTFEAYKNSSYERHMLHQELREMQIEEGMNNPSEEREQLHSKIGDLTRLSQENRIFAAGIIDGGFVFLGTVGGHVLKRDFYPQNETNPKSKDHYLLGYGILPEKGWIEPDSGVVNLMNKFRVVPLWEVDGEIVWDCYISEEDVKGHWLFYYPDEPRSLAGWVGPRGV